MFTESLAMKLRGAYLTFHRSANAFFEPRGVTADQFVVLSILADEPGLSQRELGQRAFSDPNTVGAILRRLEAARLVRRIADPHDGRARKVFLTAKGRTLRDRLAAEAETLHATLAELFAADEQNTLHDLLERVPSVFGPQPRDAASDEPTCEASNDE